MRIAVLLEELSGGGVERTTLKLAGGFLARGHAVDLLLIRDGGPLAGEVPEGARTVLLPAGGNLRTRLAVLRADPAGLAFLARPVLLAKRKRLGGILAHLTGLVDYLRTARPDVLLSAKFRPNLCAVWARKLAGVGTRVVLTERTSPAEHFPAAERGGRDRAVPRLMGRYYPRAERIVTVSYDLADELGRFAAIPRERITAIHNPVIDERLEAAALEDPDHPWFAKGEPPVVLGVGRLEGRKDFATLLRAVAIVRRTRPARVVILGQGKSPARDAAKRQELEELAAELGMADALSLPGFKANPFAYMARAGAFALTSHYEGLPGVLIQALACGCPVVSTDCPTGPREILEGGRYGPLVPVGDPDALAAALLQLLESPPPRDSLRERGRMFSVDAAVEAYLDLFRGIGAPSGDKHAERSSGPPVTERHGSVVSSKA